MKKIILTFIGLLSLSAAAQAWQQPIPTNTIAVTGVRVDYIGLSVSTNMSASGAMWVSKMSGSNPVSKVCIRVSNAVLSDLLAQCGTTLPGLGSVLLGTVGLANQNEFVTKVEVIVSPLTGKSKVLIITLSGQRRAIDEPIVNAALTQAGGSVAVFQHVFLDYAKEHAN